MTERRLAVHGGEPIRGEYLPFGRPDISEAEVRDVGAVLRSGWIGMGERTLAFERAFAEYVGARHATAVSSCTAALHLALLAHGIGPGDEVITSSLTFAATINAILATGATPVLVDVGRQTLNVDPQRVAEAVTPRTRALMPVHFGGLPCDLGALGDIAQRVDAAIIEDAAHAVGAVSDGVRIGGHGSAACFSFYPNKNMTTGEGGMLSTGDGELADQVRILRLHGLSADAWKRFGSRELIISTVERLGFKYNMTDVQAALGLGQLARLEGFLAARERLAAIYDRDLADLPVDRQQRPQAGATSRHGLHLYVILLRLGEMTADRNAIVRALRAENIGVAMHYPAVHEHPYYRTVLPYREGDFPNAEWIAERTVTLPLSPSMSDQDAADVVAGVRSVLEHYRKPTANVAAPRP